ncbi:MAG: formylglycine-generating enzyme family protein [Anaerolineales bacterium]
MKPGYFAAILLVLVAVGCGANADLADTRPPQIRTDANPEAWALVPAGEFFYGQHEHVVNIEYPYEMMVTDVTNAQYAVYLNEAAASGTIQVTGDKVMGYYPGDEFHAYNHEEAIPAGEYLHVPLDSPVLRIAFDGEEFEARPGYELHPMVNVTWFGAQAYCDFYGWRLPSEVEWEKAARGTDGRPFPWGNEIERNQANFYSSHDLFEKIFAGLGDTTPVGFYDGSVYDGYQTEEAASPFGLYDMAGNVWQWTGDVYEDQHYRYMRGGSKDNYEYNLRVWSRNSAGPAFYSTNLGFRCARNLQVDG